MEALTFCNFSPDTDKICVKKRLEPIVTPRVLNCKSWDNLPLLTMGLFVDRHPENAIHHAILQNANHMKITLIGAYNVMIPYVKDTQYTAATRLPIYNETVSFVFQLRL